MDKPDLTPLQALRGGFVDAAAPEQLPARLRGEERSSPKREIEPIPFRLTHQDLHAMRRDEHVRIRDAWIKDPPKGFAKYPASSNWP